jgi:DNA repair protein RecO (recombination protein O)
MIETATGLVLRVRPFTETSLVVHWLTPVLGRLDTVAKGARRAQSPFRGKLDLFYLAEFTFNRSRRSDLHTLREVSLRETHPPLRQDLGCLQQAAYAAKLLEQATETETPLPALFELMRGFLGALTGRPSLAQTVFAFELKLLQELGLEPDPDQSRLTPGARKVIQVLSRADWPVLKQLHLSANQTTELDQFLHGFLIYHLGRLAKGRSEAVRPSDI